MQDHDRPSWKHHALLHPRHPEARAASAASHRKAGLPELRTNAQISGKPEMGGRRPVWHRSRPVHPSRLASRAPQDDGVKVAVLIQDRTIMLYHVPDATQSDRRVTALNKGRWRS